MRLDRERGEGVVFYSGEKKGDWFVGAGLGFSGYELGARRSYRFMNPYVHFGRLFFDGKSSHTFTRRIRIPVWLWDRIRFGRERKTR